MAFRNYGMYNQEACPKTPAPSLAGTRFPMSAAFLETPSILSSIRQSSVAYQKHPTSAAIPNEPRAINFVTPFSSGSWNKNMMMFSDGGGGGGSGALPPPSRHYGSSTSIPAARSQRLNNSFLDRSFTWSQSNASFIKPNASLASSNCISVANNKSTMLSERKFSAPRTVRFPALGNFHRTKAPNLNATTSLLNSSSSYSMNSSSFVKRKYPETSTATAAAGAGPLKYMKTLQWNAKVPSMPASGQEEAKSAVAFDSKATMRIISGTIDHIQKVIREQPKYPLLLETVANVVIVKAGTRPNEKVILIRNRNVGPVLQGLYYEIDAGLPPFVAGDLVRCVGRIQPVGNRFQILKITRTTERHNHAIARLQTVSAFTTKVRR